MNRTAGCSYKCTAQPRQPYAYMDLRMFVDLELVLTCAPSIDTMHAPVMPPRQRTQFPPLIQPCLLCRC